MLKLQLRNQPDVYVMLTSGLVSLGKDESNDVVVGSGDVSDFHAEVVIEYDRVFIADLLSSSGTYVNGHRISSRQEITAWDVIRIGGTELELNDPKVDRPDAWALDISAEALGLPSQRLALQSLTVVGRDSGCDITLDSELLSRRHAEFRIFGGHLEVTDLSSVNGTYLNGRRIGDALAYPEDELSIGPYRIAVIGPKGESVARETDRTQVKTSSLDDDPRGHGSLTPSVEEDDTELLSSSAMLAFIVMLAGSAEERVIRLDGSELQIGRHPSNELSIQNASVSKFHANVRQSSKGWMIEDLNSSNGTLVNDEPCEKRVLESGDRIALGRVQLIFELRKD